MADALRGQAQIDETIRLARDATEVRIARYRVVVFAVIAALTVGMRLTGLSELWTPTIFFLGVLAYALGVRVFLLRHGNRGWLGVATLLVDLAATAAPSHIIQRLGPRYTADNPQFVMYITGPALLLVLLINTLRNSTVSSIVGAAASAFLFLATVLPIAGFHVAQVIVVTLLLLTGLIGATAAVQAKKTLDTFARLHLLRRYLAPAAVDRVLREDPDAALSTGGHLATVTLLAADLRGFTTMSEALAPEEVMAQLNAYHGVMMAVVDAHGGMLDKFMGDGTLVVFGLRSSPEEGARAAVACATGMLAALELHNAERARGGAAPLQMGIGVHTGPVVAGNLGVAGRRLEFTVIGDAVNTASRLEGQTKTLAAPGGPSAAVIVSEATAALLPDTSCLHELAPVSLRGKARSVRVYGLGALAPPQPPQPRDVTAG